MRKASCRHLHRRLCRTLRQCRNRYHCRGILFLRMWNNFFGEVSPNPSFPAVGTWNDLTIFCVFSSARAHSPAFGLRCAKMRRLEAGVDTTSFFLEKSQNIVQIVAQVPPTRRGLAGSLAGWGMVAMVMLGWVVI